MAQVMVKVKVRSDIGGSRPRQLRKKSLIPGILYGHLEKNIALTLDQEYLKKASGKLHENQIVNLVIDQDGERTQLPAIIKEIQIDRLAGRILHIDFQQIALDEKLIATVPIVAVGDAIGVTRDGGILEHILREVDIECLPADIPETIEIDVTNLGLSESIHVKDIPPQKGIEIITEPSLSIFAIAAPISEAAAAPEELEEAMLSETGEGERKEGDGIKNED